MFCNQPHFSSITAPATFEIGRAQGWKPTPGPGARTMAKASPSEKVTVSGSWEAERERERAAWRLGLLLRMKPEQCELLSLEGATPSWRSHLLKAGGDDPKEMIKGKHARTHTPPPHPPCPKPKNRKLSAPTWSTRALHRRTDAAHLKQLFGFVLFLAAAHPVLAWLREIAF